MKSWNERCVESIRREKKEIVKKYNIRIRQTDIYCARCGKPCVPGHHTCRDIEVHEIKKMKEKDSGELIDKIREFGRTKASIMLMLPIVRINHWIERGNVPKRYRDKVFAL